MRKKIDNRIRVAIENGVTTKHRTMFVVVGDKGRDQVVILHHMLSKAVVKARPNVLWCYKKELGFSSHRKKRMRQLKKKIERGQLDVREDDPFELFVAATDIRYCYYSETHKILGNTYGMCVLQDFEALSPNLLARTVETVEGGGVVVLLLRSMASLRQLYTLSMDVHARFRTEAHQDVIGRFNERFLLSLSSCENCVVIDDQLNILPLSSHALNITAIPPKSVDDPPSPVEQELAVLKESLQDTQPVGTLANCCKTLDQAKALLKFIEAISEKTLRSTVVMTAARGRGKSAALGLAMASAVAFGYSNIFVTAPSPENLKTMFEFIFKGFDALDFEEHMDYEIVESTNPEFNKAIVRVNIFREHRQTIQYIHPGDSHKLGQAELVCIDEAAAIPLPLVKKLLGPYLVFMSSTINGYEGTGRSLSLKLIHQLRQQSATFGRAPVEMKKAAELSANKDGLASASGRILHEVTLSESIRYASADPVESWLNDLLCLNVGDLSRVASGCPVPDSCELYYVNRDTLFSYHRASEAFLQRLMSLYVASHYKNTPNDLQLLSDAPAHHIFCLLGPVDVNASTLPEILCVLQVCLEGEISKQSVVSSLSRGKRASGDLIPWTVSQQFQDHDFPSLSGARVVRIATHPDYQGMGYGGRALELLQTYYEGRVVSLVETDNQPQDTAATVPAEGRVVSLVETDNQPQETAATVPAEDLGLLTERLAPRKNLPPLLLKLSERPPEKLDYLGVSYGLTGPLLKFWKRAGYTPVYLRQTTNELTGEHTCIMLKTLTHDDEVDADPSDNQQTWLRAYWTDFRRRFVSLLSYNFREFVPSLSLSLLQQRNLKDSPKVLSSEELAMNLTTYDIQRLELYSQNMVDFHLIMDLLPSLGRLYFLNRLGVSLSAAQSAILLSMGLQHKSVETVAKELELPSAQILGLFNRTIRKVKQHLASIQEAAIESQMVARKEITMEPTKATLDDDLDEAAAAVKKSQAVQLKQLQTTDLTQYNIKGSEDNWDKALKGGSKGLVSIKSSLEKKRKMKEDEKSGGKQKQNKKHKKHKGGGRG